MAREAPVGCFKGGVYVNFQGGIGLTWFHKKCWVPGALAVPKTFKNRFSFCSIFFMFSMVCFPLRKRLKNSFDLLDMHYAAGEFPSAGVAPSSNKVFWTKVFWFLTFSFRAEDAVNCGQAAELRNCHAKVDFQALFFSKFHVLPRNWKNNVENIFRNEWENLRQLKQHRESLKYIEERWNKQDFV